MMYFSEMNDNDNFNVHAQVPFSWEWREVRPTKDWSSW